MTEKRKLPARDLRRSASQILAELGRTDPSTREAVIGEFSELVPHVAAIAALLRGLNDDEELDRLHAAKSLLGAFPGADMPLSRLLSEIVESGEPEVRLAAIRQLIIILTNVLAALSGIKSDESATTGKQPDPVMEDLMEHAGRWIAWSRDRQRILAVADSFAGVMAQALKAGESDPYVRKAPGISAKAARKRFAILEDESPDILEDVRKSFPDPAAWLDAPNDSLGGEKPRDLIGTEREREVRDLLRGIEDGITT